MPEEILTPPPSLPIEITDDLAMLRVIAKGMVDALKKSATKSRGRSLAITKLEEASFWLGQALFGAD